MADRRLGPLMAKSFSNNTVNILGGEARIQFGDHISAPVQEPNRPSWADVSRWIFAPEGIFNQTAFQNSAQRKRKEPSTGAWLLEGDALARWHLRDGSFLWLEGKMGCGKTIICSTIVKGLQDLCSNDENKVMVYHYFTYTDRRSQLYDTLLKSLVLQLSKRSKMSQELVIAAYLEADNGARPPDRDELVETLYGLLVLFGSVYIVLDALDECSERGDVFDFLEDLRGRKLPGVRVLLSSKTMEEIEEALDPLFVDKVHIQSSFVDNDIRKHVAFQLSKGRDFRGRWNDADILQIEDRLTSSSDGIFQWTVAPLAEIAKCRTSDALHKTLDSLPESLNESYERALCSIGDQYGKEALKILLHWLLYSRRPLRLEELAEVVAIDTFNKPYLKSDKRLQRPKEIFDLCTCLVTLDTEPTLTDEQIRDRMFLLDEDMPDEENYSTILHDRSILRLAHASVIEYLTGDHISNGPAREYKLESSRSHLLLAEASLAYIVNFNSFDLECTSKDAQSAFPLLGYTVEFWFDHARIPLDGIERNKLDRLIAEALKTRWDIYRRLTFLPKVPRYDPWRSQENDTSEASLDSGSLCNVCKEITIEKLKNCDGFLHRPFNGLLEFSKSCSLCRLIRAALTHFAAMRSLPLMIHNTGAEDVFQRAADSEEIEIAQKSGTQCVHLIVESQDPFLLVQCSCYFGRLHLFTDLSGAVSELIPGRSINMNLDCPRVFQQISNWINNCETTHSSCQNSGSSSARTLPRRLLRVDKDQVRLKEMKNNEEVVYTTLTHCWGRLPFFKTSSSNLCANMREIPLRILTKTFQDAIQVTRALGISYLWIDALCILQDSTVDWEMEFPKTVDLYKYSALNIVAGTEASESGLFRFRWPSRIPAVRRRQSWGQNFGIGWLGTEAFSDASGSTIEELPDGWRYISPPHRRGWALQEIRSARRNLVFQSDESRAGTSISAQLYLKCQQQIIWENGRCRSLESESDDDRAWYALVEQYSAQVLTVESDRFPAIAALAREHAQNTGDQYVAGLWKRDLLRGLLWRVDQETPSEETQSRESNPYYVAPSWSWASTGYKVKFCWPPNATILAEVLGWSVQEAGEDPYGRVTGGHLVVRGSSRAFTLAALPERNAGYDPGVVEIEARVGVGNDNIIRIRCWLDSLTTLGKLDDRRVIGLRITQRLGLVLIADQVVQNAFRRVGMMVIAKGDVEIWDLHSETKEVIIV